MGTGPTLVALRPRRGAALNADVSANRNANGAILFAYDLMLMFCSLSTDVIYEMSPFATPEF